MANKKLLSNIIIIILILLFAVAVWFYYPTKTGFATLSWNANTEPDLSGYKIYYGTSKRTGDCPPGGYPEKVDAKNISSYTVGNLKSGATYYFSITSYDKSNNESCFSPEANKIIKKPTFSERIKNLFKR